MTGADRERAGAAAILTAGIVLVLAALLASPGCAVSKDTSEQLVIETTAADRIAGEWFLLTPAKRHAAYMRLRTGVWVLRYAVRGELPDDDPQLRAAILAMVPE